MCAVSMVSDYWQQQHPTQFPMGQGVGAGSLQQWVLTISREEFDKLKSEVSELKALLLAAKKFDEKTGQPNCEQEKKVELLRAVAEAVGVDLKDIFPEVPKP